MLLKVLSVLGIALLTTVILANPAYSAVPLCEVEISLSWDDGDSWSDTQEESWLCTTGGDLYRYFGSGTDLWGRSWTLDEMQNHLKVKLNATEDGFSSQYDAISIDVYYTVPPPIVTFVPPTPDNNSNVGSTFEVNATTDITCNWCKLNHNISGSFANESMSIVGGNYSIWHIEKTGIQNNTHFQYKVICMKDAQNETESRLATVYTTTPDLILNSPANDSTSPETHRILNITISDDESDKMNVTMYAWNETGYPSDYRFIYFNETIPNATLTFNFSALPLQNDTPDLYALYHLDENEDYGETIHIVKNFAPTGSVYDGYIQSSLNTYINDSGKIGRSYYFGDEISGYYKGIRIGTGTEFNNSCENGCTFSAWVNRATDNSGVIVARSESYPSSNFFFFEVYYDYLRFYIYESKSSSAYCQTNTSDLFTLGTNKWYHVAAVFNTTHVYLYADGEIYNIVPCTIQPTEANWSYFEETYIGTKQAYLPDFYYVWQGLIDEVAIFDTGLTGEEINNLYGLDEGTYYWNASATDGDSMNESDIWEFTIGAAEDTCTYTSGNWNVDCSDNCNIITNYNLGGNNLILTNSGIFNLNANITNLSRVEILGSPCSVIINDPNYMEI